MSNEEIKFEYSVFNNENWQYNVDKAFFLIALGMLYSFIRLAQHNFEASGIELIARLLTGPFTVLFAVVLFESFCAVIVKIAFEPGLLYESKFKVIPIVFWNALKESYSKVLDYKQVYSTRTIIVPQPGLVYGRIYLQGGCGLTDLQGSIELPGYLKVPDHFKLN
jgi:hypothetical protein